MKFESHRLFDSGLLPVKGSSLTRGGFYPFFACISSSIELLVVQCCVVAQNLRKGYVYMSL